MIIVPAFSEGNKAAEANIMPLHGGTFDMPITMSMIVREVANDPVPKYRNRHAPADAPRNPSQITYGIED